MQDPALQAALPALLFAVCVVGLAALLLLTGSLLHRGRRARVEQVPADGPIDPIHPTRRRFDVRLHLLAIALPVFSAGLLFLYPWAVAFRPQPAEEETSQPARTTAAATAADRPVGDPAFPTRIARPQSLFAGGLVFILLLTLGFVYDWRKGVFHWPNAEPVRKQRPRSEISSIEPRRRFHVGDLD